MNLSQGNVTITVKLTSTKQHKIISEKAHLQQSTQVTSNFNVFKISKFREIGEGATTRKNEITFPALVVHTASLD